MGESRRSEQAQRAAAGSAGPADAPSRPQSLASLFDSFQASNRAYCRSVEALYALYRTMYGEAEDAYLALGSGEYTTRDLRVRKHDLRLREIELNSCVSTTLRIGPAAAEIALNNAIGFIERCPKLFALIGDCLIAPRAAQEAMNRGRVLTPAQVRDFDTQLADRLVEDADELLALPALREAADKIVLSIDPAAAHRRRQRAEEDRTITFRPEDDEMASAYALLVTEDALELSGRVDDVAASVCDCDTRSVPQRRVDALMMLVRGFVTLGCDCGRNHCALVTPTPANADLAGGEGVLTRYRTLINVVVNERTLADPDNTELGYLVGHGPITADLTRQLAARPDAQVKPFGTRSATTPAGVFARGSAGYRPSTDLARYLGMIYPRCVFPLCNRPARRCEIDHSAEYNHQNPDAGGATTAHNLQPLCKTHHQLKTAGRWVDARLPDGRIVWVGPQGQRFTVNPSDLVLGLHPDLLRVRWVTPAAAQPDRDPHTVPSRVQREHERRAEIRRRNVRALPSEESRPRTRRSEFEARMRIALIGCVQRQRAEAANAQPSRTASASPREHLPRPPSPDDDEPPPF